MRPPTQKHREGRLLYQERYACWEMWDVYNRPVEVLCGECFEVKISDHFMPCRFELDQEWVLHFGNTRFYLHPDVSYWIRMR